MMTKQTLIQVLINNLQNHKSSQIVELVRKSNQKVLDPQETLDFLKSNIEKCFEDKWQVAIGECAAFFDKELFPYILVLYTRGKKYIIFSRGSKFQQEQLANQKNNPNESDRWE